MSSSQNVEGHDLVQWALWLPDGEAIARGEDRVLAGAELRDLATHLLEGEPELLHEWTPQALLGAVAGLEQLAAAAHELAAEAAAALAQHPQVRRGRTREASDEWVADELSMAIGVSVRQSRELIARGRATSSWLHEVAEQARAGLLDVARVRVFVEELDLVPPETVFAVLDQTLPKARHLTACALRRLVRRVVAQVDPEGQAERAESWLERRTVQPVRPGGPGMGLFAALLPAGGAVALEAACEAAAKAARSAGDGRTLDQLHADVLVAMGQQALVTGSVGVEGLTDEVFRFDPRGARVRLIATPEAQEGRAAVDPERGITGIEPYERDLYGVESDGSGDGGRGAEGGAVGGGVADRDDLDDEPLPVRPAPRPGVEVPELLGFGPVTPREAAALVSRRWVSVRPPVVLADHPPPDSPGYRPGKELLEYVRTRDQECQAPGCLVSARWCDAHHVVPWPEGPTSAENLRVLCRRHHRLVTHEGYTMTVLEDGSVRWSSPLGYVWFAVPDGRVLGAAGYRRWRASEASVGASELPRAV